jgi:hypothetical protein
MPQRYDTIREGAVDWIAAAILPGLILTACATAQPVVLTSGGRSQPISLIADSVEGGPLILRCHESVYFLVSSD